MSKYGLLSRKFSLPELPGIRQKKKYDGIEKDRKNKAEKDNFVEIKDVTYWKPAQSSVTKGQRNEDHDAYINSKNARKGTVFLSQAKEFTWKDILKSPSHIEKTHVKRKIPWKRNKGYTALPTLTDRKPKVRHQSNITRCYSTATGPVPVISKHYLTSSFYNEDLTTCRQLDHKAHKIESTCINNPCTKKKGLYCDVMGFEMCEKCIEVNRRNHSIGVHRQLYPSIQVTCDSLCRNHTLKQYFSELDLRLQQQTNDENNSHVPSKRLKQRLIASATSKSSCASQSGSHSMHSMRDRGSTLSGSFDLRSMALDPPFLSIYLPLSASDITIS